MQDTKESAWYAATAFVKKKKRKRNIYVLASMCISYFWKDTSEADKFPLRRGNR